MLSNDILRSVRYILKANNNDLVRILALGNVEATAEQIAVWLRKEDEEGFQRCPDIVLSSFLNGNTGLEKAWYSQSVIRQG